MQRLSPCLLSCVEPWQKQGIDSLLLTSLAEQVGSLLPALHVVCVMQGLLVQGPMVDVPPTPLRSVTTVWSLSVTAW
jgi:hypothetical protein